MRVAQLARVSKFPGDQISCLHGVAVELDEGSARSSDGTAPERAPEPSPISTRPTQSWEERAFRMAIIYSIAGALWVSLSDIAVDRVLDDPVVIGLLKGLLFVAVTAVLLLAVSQSWGRQIDDHLRGLWRERTVATLMERVDSTLLGRGDLHKAMVELCDDLAALGTSAAGPLKVELRYSLGPTVYVVGSGGRRGASFASSHPSSANEAPAQPGSAESSCEPDDNGQASRATFRAPDDSGSGWFLELTVANIEPDEDVNQIASKVAERLPITIGIAEQQQELLQVRGAVEAAANAIAIIDLDMEVMWANPKFWELTGYSPDAIRGMPATGLVDPASFEQVGGAAVRTILGGDTWRGELLMRRKDGSRYVARHTFTPVRDPSGAVSHVISVHEDLTDQRQMEQRLAHLATHDPLTSLPNRYLFLDRVGRQIQTAPKVPASIVVLGIAGFTEVNEALGTDTGNQLLRLAAQRLTHMCRHDEHVACVHGDQFGILLVGNERPEDVAMRAEVLLEAIAEPFTAHGREVILNARAGIAVHPQDGTTPEELLTHATTAMRSASRVGRDRLQFHAISHNLAANERLALHRDLRVAVEQHQLLLHFQPQIDLMTVSCVGAEALIRWQHPTRGLLYPGEFLNVMEESDLSAAVNRWVLDSALAACHEMRQYLPEARIGVNISPVHFHDGDVVPMVARALESAGLGVDALEIELLETTLFAGDDIPPSVGQLRDLGVRQAVDDFGTGYSTLARMADLPVDLIKIDRSFVSQLDTHDRNQSIVKAIIGISEVLQVETLAEGVETATEAQAIVELGCNLAQGYFFARPMPLTDLLQMIRASNGRWKPVGESSTPAAVESRSTGEVASGP